METNRRIGWVIAAILTTALILIGCLAWIQDHPYGTSWDESLYFNEVITDLQTFRNSGVAGLARSIVVADPYRPPAYRVLAVPFLLVTDFSPTVARLISLSFLVVTLALVFLATRRVAGTAAGVVALIFLALSPIIIYPSMTFGTEYPLFLAIAAMLYFLFREWTSDKSSNFNWIGLGLALGLGALAKASFAAISGPLLALVAFLSWRRQINLPSVRFLVKAVALGVIIAAPWWLPDARPALRYAIFSTSFEAHSLGSPSLATLARWLNLFALSVLGPVETFLTGALLLSLVVKLKARPGSVVIDKQSLAFGVCLLSALPLLLAPSLTANGNTRHIAPAVILIAAGVGILAKTTRLLEAPVATVAAAALFGAQMLATIAPTVRPIVYPPNAALFDKPPWLVLAREEQWDWDPFRAAVQADGLKDATISLLGGAREFNPPAVAYPWVSRREAWNTQLLWQDSLGPISWDGVMKNAAKSDVVLTIPNPIVALQGEQSLDNQHNDEFIGRLEAEGQFAGPFPMKFGRYNPVEVDVFVTKADLAAH